jgi:DNA-binding GntR family transcriptional regulator
VSLWLEPVTAIRSTRIIQANLDEVVYRVLREEILSPGGLDAGDRLDEKDLSERLGVSRTPIREAIRRLEVEGLIKRAPRRGSFVAGLSPDAIDELYSLREVLEGLAARLAAARATDAEIAALRETYARYAAAVQTRSAATILTEDTAFHELIFLATRSERLQAMLRMLRDQLRLLRTRSVAVAGRSEKSLQEMGRVLDAIARRQPDEAEEAMRLHIRGAQVDVLNRVHHSDNVP